MIIILLSVYRLSEKIAFISGAARVTQGIAFEENAMKKIK